MFGVLRICGYWFKVLRSLCLFKNSTVDEVFEIQASGVLRLLRLGITLNP